MSKIKDGGPAFPLANSHVELAGTNWEHANGLTLRDYFAIHAPEPTKDRMDIERSADRNRNPYNDAHKPPLRSDTEIRAALSYEYADAMLCARGEA